ncbi:beta-lactamase family protein [Paenibacillus sp. ACRSA]|uniref:beta-lactamase family protein n=1 Tax=Paenibacillus sp. ACRSA TaxID=2918211 RepID=UPI001EF67BE0|nr:beta-lactamase family protein [Paenibacillus sp. ACRSA]MCG7378820.1 beta-lactamase family protein [Paenibacillus sp. ACRSA]
MAIEERIEAIIKRLQPETHLQNKYGQEATLKERMRYYNTPGVSIAVIHDFKLEWARGFGLCEAGKPEAVNETTLFQAASVSKPIFALAVMRLVQEGKLDLDRDVNEYLTSWKIPSVSSWQPKVTLRQLLSHSAGVTIQGFPGYERTNELPTLVQILNGQPPANTSSVEVNMIPGLQFRYSGGGTTIVQQLVEDTLNQPLDEIMSELIFSPLGLMNSTYEQPLPSHRHESTATGHPWKGKPLSDKWYVYPEMAAAGLWTVPSDLARIGIELQSTLKHHSSRILSADTLNEMLTAQIENHMGLGFFLEGEGEGSRFGHNGWNEGFVSRFVLSKHHGYGAVIMINSNEGNALLGEIEHAIAREYEWLGYSPDQINVDVSSNILKEYVGDYKATPGLHASINLEGNDLALRIQEQSPIRLSPKSETKFSTEGLNTSVDFERNDDGQVVALHIHQEGRAFRLDKTID